MGGRSRPLPRCKAAPATAETAEAVAAREAAAAASEGVAENRAESGGREAFLERGEAEDVAEGHILKNLMRCNISCVFFLIVTKNCKNPRPTGFQ